MGRQPNPEREAAEEASALVSSAESVHRMERLCCVRSERARMHADTHDLMLKAIKVLVRMHLPVVPIKKAKANQLRLVA